MKGLNICLLKARKPILGRACYRDNLDCTMMTLAELFLDNQIYNLVESQIKHVACIKVIQSSRFAITDGESLNQVDW